MTQKPVVYTLTTCPTCVKLKRAWKAQGREFEERAVDGNQKWLTEALQYADTVPIILYPQGRVEVGFEGEIG
mgnify:CR=1 FL=1